jgi:hypothetical protein
LHAESIRREQSIPISIIEFLNIVSELDAIGNPCKCGVVFPLLSKWKKIRLKVPSTLEEIETELDIEPPSLFLETWETRKNYERIEEYRYPIDSNLLLDSEMTIKAIENFFSYYREFRYSEALLENFEYSRCIYIEYFPNGKI